MSGGGGEQAFYYQVVLPDKEQATGEWSQMDQEATAAVAVFVILKPYSDITEYSGNAIVTSTNSNLEGIKNEHLWQNKGYSKGADAALHKKCAGQSGNLTKLSKLCKEALAARRDGVKRRARARRDDDRRAGNSNADITPPASGRKYSNTISPSPRQPNSRSVSKSPRPTKPGASTRQPVLQGYASGTTTSPRFPGADDAETTCDLPLQPPLQGILKHTTNTSGTARDNQPTPEATDEEDDYGGMTGAQNKRMRRGNTTTKIAYRGTETTIPFSQREDVTGVREKVIVGSRKPTASPRPMSQVGAPVPHGLKPSPRPPGGNNTSRNVTPRLEPGSARNAGSGSAQPAWMNSGTNKQITPRLNQRQGTAFAEGSHLSPDVDDQREGDVSAGSQGEEDDDEADFSIPDEYNYVVVTEDNNYVNDEEDCSWSCSYDSCGDQQEQQHPSRSHSKTSYSANSYSFQTALGESKSVSAAEQEKLQSRSGSGTANDEDQVASINELYLEEGAHAAVDTDNPLNKKPKEGKKEKPPNLRVSEDGNKFKFNGEKTLSLDDTFPNPTFLKVMRTRNISEKDPHSRFPGMQPNFLQNASRTTQKLYQNMPLSTAPPGRKRLTVEDVEPKKQDDSKKLPSNQVAIKQYTIHRGGGMLNEEDDDELKTKNGSKATRMQLKGTEASPRDPFVDGTEITPRSVAAIGADDFTNNLEYFEKLAPFEILETNLVPKKFPMMKCFRILHISLPAFPRESRDDIFDSSNDPSSDSNESDSALLGDLRQRRNKDSLPGDDRARKRAQKQKNKSSTAKRKEKEQKLLTEVSKLLLEEVVETEAEAEERLRAGFRDTLWYALHFGHSTEVTYYQKQMAEELEYEKRRQNPDAEQDEDGQTDPSKQHEKQARGQPRHMKLAYPAIGCGSLNYPPNLAAGHAFGGWMEVMRILKGSLYPTLVTIEIRFGGDIRTFNAWKEVSDAFLRRNVKDEHGRKVKQMQAKIDGRMEENVKCCGLFAERKHYRP
ncbi:unnamed protein product [Amoebophrya sp. A120]|nr:unnamed protein product [Amoebophrya sp. A120]|eukprot:GSA120T00019677001.1